MEHKRTAELDEADMSVNKIWRRGRLLLMAAVAAALFYVIFGNPVLVVNEARLKKALTSMDVSQKTLTLEETVPFSWDEVYSFDPYTSREEMERVLGFPDSGLKETVNEGMVHLVFIKKERVVCCVCGYADILCYSASLPRDENAPGSSGYGMLRFGDNCVFQIEKEGEIFYLKPEK